MRTGEAGDALAYIMFFFVVILGALTVIAGIMKLATLYL